jgi:hypothetical protein
MTLDQLVALNEFIGELIDDLEKRHQENELEIQMMLDDMEEESSN